MDERVKLVGRLANLVVEKTFSLVGTFPNFKDVLVFKDVSVAYSCNFTHLQPFLCCQDLLGVSWVSSGFHLGLAWVCFRPSFSPHVLKKTPNRAVQTVAE